MYLDSLTVEIIVTGEGLSDIHVCPGSKVRVTFAEGSHCPRHKVVHELNGLASSAHVAELIIRRLIEP